MKVFILAIFVSCALTTNATTTSAESTTLSSVPYYPSDDYCPIEEIKTCGYKYGTPAAKKQFPHVAFLKSKNAFKVQYCSGSLIHPKWVLTSAYCTLPHSIVEVTLGALVPLDEEDPDRVVVQSDVIYIHPEYLPFYKNPKNDVALIKLPRPVKSATIIPIVLKRNNGLMFKENVIFAGWGEAGYETLTFTETMGIFKGPCKCVDSDNREDYDKAEVDSEFFCGLSHSNFCFLHNGAGLVVDGVLVAVLSTRCFPHCRQKEAIFTNLYKHWPWIITTVDEDFIPKIYGACSDIPTILSGVYLIQPNNNVDPFEVYCELSVHGGKWTVIHQRFSKSDFYKNYASYTKGFGPIDGDHWLGLEKIHQLTKNGDYELLVDMQAHNLTRAYALYSTFKVGSAGSGFKLTISDYSGTAGDSMYDTPYSSTNLNGMKFTTYDKDQDKWSSGNCAEYYKGAWWHKSCTWSQLTGVYHDSAVYDDWKTMYWYYNLGKYALKTSRMLIRRK